MSKINIANQKNVKCCCCDRRYATVMIYIKEIGEIQYMCRHCANNKWPDYISEYPSESTASAHISLNQWPIDFRDFSENPVDENHMFGWKPFKIRIGKSTKKKWTIFDEELDDIIDYGMPES